MTPTANQQFKNVEQPITLTVKNAVTSGTTPLTYTFEVASDAAFGTKVFSKDGVAARERHDRAEDRQAAGEQELLLARARAERIARWTVHGGPRLRRSVRK